MDNTENKYFDFDAFMEERKGTEKAFIVKAFGEEHELPNDVPFDVILNIQRAHKDGKKEMTDEETLSMCRMIFGQTAFDKWVKNGIGVKGIMVLTEKVMDMYMDKSVDMSREIVKEKKEKHPNP